MPASRGAALSPAQGCGAGDRRRRGDPCGGGTAPRHDGVAGATFSPARAGPSAPRVPEREPRGPPLVPQDTSRALGRERTSNPGPAGRGGANKVGAQRRSVRGSPRPCAPPAARHYLHEDPEEQGSNADLDGQFPHGAAGAAPGRRQLVLSATPAARPAPARQTRGAREALQAAGGGGRREPGGGGGGGEEPAPPPSAGPGAPALRPRAQRGAPRGLPAPARRLRALGPRRGPAAREGSPGKPRRLLPARCALPAAGRPLRLPAGPPARAPPSGRPAHARGPVVGARWGFSPAGGSPGAPCLHLPNLKYVLFPRKFPRDHSQAAFCLQEAPARRRSPGTD